MFFMVGASSMFDVTIHNRGLAKQIPSTFVFSLAQFRSFFYYSQLQILIPIFILTTLNPVNRHLLNHTYIFRYFPLEKSKYNPSTYNHRVYTYQQVDALTFTIHRLW